MDEIIHLTIITEYYIIFTNRTKGKPMDISIIFSQLLILFIIMALGYLLNKIGLMTKTFNAQLTKLILNVTTPALILDSVLGEDTTLSGKTVLITFIVGAGMYLILPVFAKLITLLLRTPKEQRGIYDFISIYANVGFMGFPLVAAILGPDALLLTAIFNIVFNLSVYSVGIMIICQNSDRKERFSPKKIFTPGILFSILAVFLYLFHVSFPQTICTVIKNVGSLTSTLAMLVIGSTLATMSLKDMFTDVRVYAHMIVRQLLLPLLCWPLMKLLIHDNLLLTVTFIMLIMPVGNTSVLFATEYGQDQTLAAKSVFITTVCCIITIPLLVMICL